MKRSISCFLLLASCGVYKGSFDCPPGEGIGCAPVGEVLDLIVEREDGEDLFVHNKGTALLLKQEEANNLRRPPSTEKKFYLSKDSSGNLYLVKIRKETP